MGKSGQPIAASGFPWGTFYLAPLYFGSMFLATFFNVAFYSEIIAALNGQGVSFRRGLRTARNRLPSILAWSLLAGLVGWLIRSLEQRLPFFARIATGFIGMAWSIAAVFAIPVIIRNEPMRNPIKILQQSATTLKRTWGEGLIGYLGFSAGSLVIFMVSLVPLVLAIVVAVLIKSPWLGVIAVVAWMLGLFLMSYISAVAGHIYRCALYLYATEGVVPEPYNQDLLDMAWKVKSKS
jgi:CHASE2 domain-containing sensor protein